MTRRFSLFYFPIMLTHDPHKIQLAFLLLLLLFALFSLPSANHWTYALFPALCVCVYLRVPFLHHHQPKIIWTFFVFVVYFIFYYYYISVFSFFKTSSSLFMILSIIKCIYIYLYSLMSVCECVCVMCKFKCQWFSIIFFLLFAPYNRSHCLYVIILTLLSLYYSHHTSSYHLVLYFMLSKLRYLNEIKIRVKK